jgi:transposase
VKKKFRKITNFEKKFPNPKKKTKALLCNMGKRRRRRHCRTKYRPRKVQFVRLTRLKPITGTLTLEQKRLILIITHKQSPEYSASILGKWLNLSVRTVYTWWNKNEDDVKDKHRCGAPTVLTLTVMRAIRNIRGKWNKSTRKLIRQLIQRKIKISRSSVRNGIKKCGLKPYHPRTVFRTSAKHRLDRKKFAKNFKNRSIKFWEGVISTDEKIFVFQQIHNKQNDLIYETSLDNVPIIPKDKHPIQHVSLFKC